MLRGDNDAASSRRLQFAHLSARTATPPINYVDGEMRVSVTPGGGVLRGLMGCQRQRLKCISHCKTSVFQQFAASRDTLSTPAHSATRPSLRRGKATERSA